MPKHILQILFLVFLWTPRAWSVDLIGNISEDTAQAIKQLFENGAPIIVAGKIIGRHEPVDPEQLLAIELNAQGYMVRFKHPNYSYIQYFTRKRCPLDFDECYWETDADITKVIVDVEHPILWLDNVRDIIKLHDDTDTNESDNGD